MEFSWVLVAIIFVGYICVYSLVDRVCKCAENCALAKAFAIYISTTNSTSGANEAIKSFKAACGSTDKHATSN